ncbi:hypothetical protein NVP2275O_097 [Vibrio phage 2.275.O._10N.286.54.E11]|nr:hypothetical protein NVP2275O_097 [Vibrio phage 2.275.O._10N.286.54.E11]
MFGPNFRIQLQQARRTLDSIEEKEHTEHVVGLRPYRTRQLNNYVSDRIDAILSDFNSRSEITENYILGRMELHHELVVRKIDSLFYDDSVYALEHKTTEKADFLQFKTKIIQTFTN